MVAIPPNDHTLFHRLRQLEIVAGFGVFAMRAASMGELLAESCRIAALGLETPFSKVLEYQPAQGDFLIRAGVGWRPGVVGHARLGAGMDSPAGYAFETGQPITANELSGEQRFRTPSVLAEHGIRRAINVIIRAGDAAPYGVLEGDSTDRDAFDAHDSDFLQGLANTLAAALALRERVEAVRTSETLARGVFEASPDCMKMIDRAGVVQSINVNGLRLMDYATPKTLRGHDWRDLWPESERGKVEAALTAARRGEPSRFTGFAPTLQGTARHWDVSVSPLPVEGDVPERFVVVSRDVTDLVTAMAEKDRLLADKDLLMQEVHHRVKNSLQLVRTLLQLQARVQPNPEVQTQLQEAAARIMAIGAVHQRLYEGVSVAETDAVAYLAGVVADLRSTSAETASGRAITLDVEPMVLAADHVTPLGLITVELVTNALKYGAGRVHVAVKRTDVGVEIAVEDEGAGFPEGYEPGSGRTLGMRLVTAWSKGGAGPHIDRSIPFGRISTVLALPPS